MSSSELFELNYVHCIIYNIQRILCNMHVYQRKKDICNITSPDISMQIFAASICVGNNVHLAPTSNKLNQNTIFTSS